MGVRQVEQLTDRHIEELHALYQNEWWTRGRLLDDVREMVRHSDLTIALCEEESGRLVAFVRVLTDRVYKGLVLDVIVADDYRGQKLGKALIDAVVSHPLLQKVRHLELYCRPELVPFYERWGFTANLGDLHFMRRTAPQ